jgi:hypothetical protein
MEKQFTSAVRVYLLVLAIVGWFALIGQFYLILNNRQTSVLETITRYFTFFTILTNILIAAGSTLILLKPLSGWGKFFSKATTLTAIAVNITIVGATYNIILRFLWNPQGMQRVVDELLHLVIPLAFILFWLIFVPKGQVKWNNIPLWTVYPLAYLAVILIRGALSGYYPYPFLEVTQLRYPHVLLNCAGIAVAFIIVAILFVGVDKLMSKNQSE